MDNQKEKSSKKLPVLFCILPVVLFFIGFAILVFTLILGIRTDWKNSYMGIFLLSFIGTMLLLIASIVFEIIGLVKSFKLKSKSFITILSIEMALTAIFGALYIYLSNVWSFFS